jgi:hypothetical protein
MAFVPVPKDLSKVKTKVALNLTKRQIICFAFAGAIGVPIYFATRGAIGNSAAILIMMGLMLPFFFLAMYERDGQPAEILLRNFIRAKLWPAKRLYKTENLYKYLEEEAKHIAKRSTTNTRRSASAPKRKAGKAKPQYK